MSDPPGPPPPRGPLPGPDPSFTWGAPGGPSLPPGGEPSWGPAQEPVTPAVFRPRGPLVVALAIVVVLSGAALLASGFTLGLQQALAPGTSSADQALFDPFWEAYRKITTEYVGDLDRKALVEGAIGGMFDALGDPYSSYMTQEEYDESLAGISGEFEGVGATMGSRDADGSACPTLGASCFLVVDSVIRDSPAEKAGLLPGDRVTAVDGVPVDGSTLEEVVTWIKGPRGTPVTLSLVRGGGSLDLPITRDVVRTESVRSESLADGAVGYLDVDGFSASAAEDFRTHLKAQLDGGIRRFVVDVRDDPGGFVDAARSIASQFIASGPVYWEEYADGRQVPTEAQGGGLATEPSIQVAVLVNGGSASASELLAGALQDTGRGTLVGEQTYGKGTVQQWHLLSNESGGFRLSVARWLTPDKRSIHEDGLTPDVVVSPSDPGDTTDPQLDRAVALLLAEPVASGHPRGSAPPSSPPARTTSPDLRPSASPAAVRPGGVSLAALGRFR